MSNRLQTIASSKLLENKAKVLFGDLSKDFSELNLQEKEEILMKYNDTVKKLYSTLATPLLSPTLFRQGKPVDIRKINEYLKNTEQDLKTIYEEFANIRFSLANNFNSLNMQTQRVRTSIARVLSDIADYKAQNKNSGVFTFSDSFNNMDKIEADPDKYKNEKFFIDNEWQVATLPLQDPDPDPKRIIRLSINDNSNGVPGNNQEIASLTRDNPTFMNDKNLDTWYEYERVSRNQFTTPLVFEFEIELEKDELINLIEMDLVDFPNGSAPVLTEIETSNDGILFYDFFSNYIGPTVTDSRNDEVIQLGSRDGNPVDKTRLLFFPKKAKYLRIKLIQDSDFRIRTASGLKNRMAIGIKEIAIKGMKFQNRGEFLSKDFESTKEIGKVLLKTMEYIPAGFGGELKYSISTDKGQKWHEITPTQKVNLDVPEVLNFNLDFIEDSIKTERAVTSVKLKAEYRIEAPEGDDVENTIKIQNDKTEFVSIAAGTKKISLEEIPSGDVNMLNVGFGSVGSQSFYAVPTSFIFERDTEYVVKLPLEVFKRNNIDKDSEVIYCEDFIWQRVDDLRAYGASDRVYEFDYVNNHITFARVDSNGDQYGKKPNEKILLQFKREAPLLENIGEKARVLTRFENDKVKDSIKLYKLSDTLFDEVKKLKPRSQVHNLGVKEVESINVVTDEGSNLLVERDFLNGYIELGILGDYSIDYQNGILYTYSEIADTDTTEIEVFYYKREDVKFDVKDGYVSIKKDDYTTQLREEQISVSGSFVIDLGYKNVEKGSIIFNGDYPELGTELSYTGNAREFDDIDDIEGPYSVDYREGLIYLPSKVTGDYSVRFNTTKYFIEYNIASKIAKTDINIRRDDKIVELSDAYIVKYFADSNISSTSGLFKIEYKYAEEVEEPPKDLLPFVTPILDGYDLQVIFKEDL